MCISDQKTHKSAEIKHKTDVSVLISGFKLSRDQQQVFLGVLGPSQALKNRSDEAIWD